MNIRLELPRRERGRHRRLEFRAGLFLKKPNGGTIRQWLFR